MKAFTDAVGLGMVRFDFAMINIFNGQVELIFVVLNRTIVFGASGGQYPQQAERLLFKPGRTRSLSNSAAVVACSLVYSLANPILV